MTFETSQTKRKVVQLIPIVEPGNYWQVVALCDDGTIWVSSGGDLDDAEWGQMEQPPGCKEFKE